MSVVDEIKQRVDAVELIGSYVPLKKAGRSFKGLCPFHTEKTPSFVVFPDSQGWHCFGACSTGGDIFSFVMRRENMDFAEALRFLAERAGIDLRPLDDTELQQKEQIDRLRAANASAAQYYHRILLDAPEGEAARRYLEARGVTRETTATFQLGYAPEQWHSLQEHLRREHFSDEDVLASGLVSASDSGSVYDRFRGRIMFPIRDVRGRVIGFGARVLDDSLPKYLNSPQSPLFDKSSVLYGIDLARQSIRDSGTAIVVEGYMDVIIPHQCGVTNLVACMGTALTEAHLAVLKRITNRLILALDPDAAGMLAVERGVETARETLRHRTVPVPTATGLVRYEEQLDAEIRVLTLPDGLDPDELVLDDRSRWDRLVSEALPVADYFFQVAEREADVSTAKGKRQAADRLLPVIAAMDSPVERSHYLQRLAQWVRIDERQLLPELDRLRSEKREKPAAQRISPGRRRPSQQAPPERLYPRQPAMDVEENCLALLLQAPTLLPKVIETCNLSDEAFQDVRNRQIFRAMGAFLAAHTDFALGGFRAGLDTELSGHVESLLERLRSGPALSFEMMQEDAIKSAIALSKLHLARLIAELHFMLQDAAEEGLEEDLRQIYKTITALNRDLQDINRGYYAATLMGRKRAREGSDSDHGP